MQLLILLFILLTNCEEFLLPNGDLLETFNKNFASLISWRSDCAQHALQELIPQCMNQGIESITPTQQRQLALQLSICQFENSGVKYPEECQGQDIDNEQCILNLESRAQYWTTYSGYYQDVKNICHQISLPYEKDQILSIYENITSVYQKIYEDMRKSQVYTQQMKDLISRRFKEMIDIVDNILKQRESQYKEEWTEFQQEFKHSLNNTLVVLEDGYNDIHTNINHVNKRFDYFINQMLDIYDLIETQNQQQQRIIENNNAILSQQNSIINLSDVINNDIDGITNHIELELINLHQKFSEQTLILNQKIPTILLEFKKELTANAKDLIESFELILNESLYNLESKLNNTEEVIDLINVKILQLANYVEVFTSIIKKLFEVTKYVFSYILRYWYWIVVTIGSAFVFRTIVKFKIWSIVYTINSIIFPIFSNLLQNETILLLLSIVFGVGMALFAISFIRSQM